MLHPEGPATLLLGNSGPKSMINMVFKAHNSLLIWYLDPPGQLDAHAHAAHGLLVVQGGLGQRIVLLLAQYPRPPLPK